MHEKFSYGVMIHPLRALLRATPGEGVRGHRFNLRYRLRLFAGWHRPSCRLQRVIDEISDDSGSHYEKTEQDRTHTEDCLMVAADDGEAEQ